MTMREKFHDIVNAHVNVDYLFPREEIAHSLTGQKVRQLLNYAVSKSQRYLELGVYCGATFCAAMYGNDHVTAIAIDSWAEEFGITKHHGKKPREEFRNNLARYVTTPTALIESDHWNVRSLPCKPDLYFYDGDHSQLAQEKALTHYAKFCDDQFIFIVDDYNWERVQRGTLLGINKSGLRVLEFSHLGDGRSDDAAGYWNGIGIFLLSKS